MNASKARPAHIFSVGSERLPQAYWDTNPILPSIVTLSTFTPHVEMIKVLTSSNIIQIAYAIFFDGLEAGSMQQVIRPRSRLACDDNNGYETTFEAGSQEALLIT